MSFFAPGLPDLAAVRAVCKAVSKPFNFMAGIKGKSFSVAELAAAGVRRISLATSLAVSRWSALGDWSRVAGRHGILGMELEDVDRKRRFITVRLKGARDQHRVPVTDDFCSIYEEYLRSEPRAAPDAMPSGLRRGKGRCKPLRYATFESALRYIGRKAGISVHPHLFRQTLAQGVLEATGNIKVAPEILGHSHLSTTADLYLRVDQHAMVTALATAKSSTGRAQKHQSWPSAKAEQYVFDYDDKTISELERSIAQASGVKPPGGDS